MEKYNDEDFNNVLNVLYGNADEKELLNYLSGDTVKKEFLQASDHYSEMSEDALREILKKVYMNIAHQMTKSNINTLIHKNEQYDYSQFPVDPMLIESILEQQENYEGGLSNSEIVDLILLTENAPYIKQCFKSKQFSFSFEDKERLSLAIDRINEYNASIDQTYTQTNPSQINISVVHADTDGPLSFTDEEKYAIKVYEGVSPGGGPLANSYNSYETMNAMLFPGIINEVTRIFDDRKYLIPDSIRNADELMTLTDNLYSAMYKYGKTMSRDMDENDTVKVLRVDRSASFPLMELRGEILSNFSTTTASHYKTMFKKAKITLVEANIEPGASCIDFSAALGNDYQYDSEQEILIAPFSKVEMQEVELSDSEKRITDLSGNPPERKILMTVKSQEKATPLSTEETEDKENLMKVFSDPVKRENAATFLELIHSLHQSGYSKEQVLQMFQTTYVDKFNDYMEWKNAFQTVFRYHTREIALSIDKSIEEQDRAENAQVESGSGVGKLIDADELEKLVTSRGLDEINDSINKAKANIKIKESGRDEEVNDKDEI